MPCAKKPSAEKPSAAKPSTTANTQKTRLWLGSSGYSNDDWRGMFYPPQLTAQDTLGYYSQHFPVVELNSSFYATPKREMFAKMAASALRVIVKVHQTITHQRTATAEVYRGLLEASAPLREAGLLVGYLLQFPFSFQRTPDSRRYLAACVKYFQNMPVAVAFRHDSWQVDTVINACREQGLIWVSCDYPPLAGLPAAALHISHEVAFLRLHGRNEDAWYRANSAAERHDYRYDEAELREWLEPLQHAQVRDAYMIFANTTKGHALVNMATVRELASDYDLHVVEAPSPHSNEQGRLL